MERVSCEFQYSRAAAAFLAAAVAATLALVAFVPYPGEVRALVFAAVVALACHAHRGLRQVAALDLDCGGSVSVRDPGGGWRHGSVRDGSFVAPWLTILRWRPEGARIDRTLLILPDMLPERDMRKIRVILQWA